jgi:hypothetical protein
VFLYSIGDIPTVLGRRDVAPIHTPTVLDGGLSTAFCPAPIQLDRGHPVDLSGLERDEAAHEMLHPPLPDITAEFLFRVGKVITMPGEPASGDGIVTPHRAWHIFLMRQASSDDTFAIDTDHDLL